LEKGLRKQPGYSWIKINGKVHTFIVDDRVHLQIVEICVELERFSVLMNELGYAPETRFVLHDVEEEEKAFHLCLHSAKLAIALGLSKHLVLHSKFTETFGCLTTTKFIAKLSARAIMLRDVK
jgi:hypothetical protein